MQVVFSRQPPPASVEATLFLAGPTPRTRDVPSWRPRALQLLRELGFAGTVFVPEDEGGPGEGDLDADGYAAQVAWEETCLSRADGIVFWVPRDMRVMPALTTNVEWGMWRRSGKVVLGTPPEAEHVRYLRHDAASLGVPVLDTLDATLVEALRRIGPGARRTGGEAEVPLGVWRTPQLQAWYRAQRAAGNRLEGARVCWEHRTGPAGRFPFLWALQADLHVAAEGRVKRGDLVLGRPDVSTVAAFARRGAPGEAEVLLVREARPAAAATEDGFVLELPGGCSTHGASDPRAVAAAELSEETGLTVDAGRLLPVAPRQLAATLLSHRAHVFTFDLEPDEVAAVRERQGRAFGEAGTSERTYPELHRVGDLLTHTRLDWSTVGMVLAALRTGAATRPRTDD